MFGAIVGDIIGSKFEFKNTSEKDFPLFSETSKFTDDTILTCATAEKLLFSTNYQDTYRRYSVIYANSGFGGGFKKWVASKNPVPYNSYGNGSAMRVSPVGWAFDKQEDVLEEAKRSAEVTHSHPEGIKGAQAIALAIFLARQGKSKKDITFEVGVECDYDFSLTVDAIPRKFDVSCQGTIPICFAVFNETDNFEDAIRTAISLGGDSDTNAAIVGSIAEAFYGEIPIAMVEEAKTRLPFLLRYITDYFYRRYNKDKHSIYFPEENTTEQT